MKKLIAYLSLADLPLLKGSDLAAVDLVNLAFAHVDGDQLSFSPPPYFREETERLRREHPGLEIVLSVGGWSSGGFSEMARNERSRKNFAHSAQDLVMNYALDGIDIDWEYPCFRVAGIQAHPNDKENFTYLLRDLRAALNLLPGERRKRLSIAAGADRYFIKNTEVHKYIDYLDYIQLMSYDYRAGFSLVTAHHTNLYEPDRDLYDCSAATAVRLFREAGVPSEKLILGAAYYSREWKDVKAESAEQAYGIYCSGIGAYGPSYDEICEQNLENRFQKIWDERASAAYLYGDSRFISYDDEQSFAAKAAYVRRENLGGLMFWEYRLGARSKITTRLGQWLHEDT